MTEQAEQIKSEWVRTVAHDGQMRMWAIYACSSCDKVVVATGPDGPGTEATEVYPAPRSVAGELPDEPKRFLRDAISCLHAPSLAIVGCASAIDAMLKAKKYETGWLNDRINQAIEDGLLTEEMGTWAYHIRLEANDQRHADKNAKPPTTQDAEQSLEFAEAFAEILFVLLSRIKRGIKRAQGSGQLTVAGSATATVSEAPRFPRNFDSF